MSKMGVYPLFPHFQNSPSATHDLSVGHQMPSMQENLIETNREHTNIKLFTEGHVKHVKTMWAIQYSIVKSTKILSPSGCGCIKINFDFQLWKWMV